MGDADIMHKSVQWRLKVCIAREWCRTRALEFDSLFVCMCTCIQVFILSCVFVYMYTGLHASLCVYERVNVLTCLCV